MIILSPFGRLYGKIADLRNTLYDKGIFQSHSLGARTISIGNITTGGTGKTPLVARVAEILAESGERVCILTRGYGRANPKTRVLVSDGENVLVDAKTGGDEPVELALKLLRKAVVIADADRVAASKWALEKFGITAFVLDDAFQHRRAKRDLDIVCIDATKPFENEQVLPAGTLREPLEKIGRADVIVITRADLAENIVDLRSQISNLFSAARIFQCENQIAGVRRLDEFHAKTQSAQIETMKQKSLAFCGLGNPGNFFDQLKRDGFEIKQTKAFPDHHFYTQEDVSILKRIATESGAEVFLTTAKDAVKLKGLKIEIPCYVIEIEPVIDDEKTFRELINASS